MPSFPSKQISKAYESAVGKVFTRSTTTGEFRDQLGSMDYDHAALGWLCDQGWIVIEYMNPPKTWCHHWKLR